MQDGTEGSAGIQDVTQAGEHLWGRQWRVAHSPTHNTHAYTQHIHTCTHTHMHICTTHMHTHMHNAHTHAHTHIPPMCTCRRHGEEELSLQCCHKVLMRQFDALKIQRGGDVAQEQGELGLQYIHLHISHESHMIIT